jgi:hypothetical protein
MRQMPEPFLAGKLDAMPHAKEKPPVQQFRRLIAVLSLLAAIATAPPVTAQAERTGPTVCSDQARQGLREVGAWAEAQCSSTPTLSFAPLPFQRCSDQAVQGLGRVGAWAEAQCATDDRVSRAPAL